MGFFNKLFGKKEKESLDQGLQKTKEGFLSKITDRVLYPVFSFLAALVAFLSISKLAALIVVIITIPNFIYRLKLSKAERKLWNDTWTERRKASSYLELAGQRFVKESRVLGLVEFARKTWWDMSQKLILSSRKLDVKNEKFNAIDGSVSTVIEYILLIIVIFRIASGELEVGYFIFAQTLIRRFLNATYSMSSGISIVDEDIALLTDYVKFMELEEEEPSTLQNQPELLKSPCIKPDYYVV